MRSLSPLQVVNSDVSSGHLARARDETVFIDLSLSLSLYLSHCSYQSKFTHDLYFFYNLDVDLNGRVTGVALQRNTIRVLCVCGGVLF